MFSFELGMTIRAVARASAEAAVGAVSQTTFWVAAGWVAAGLIMCGRRWLPLQARAPEVRWRVVMVSEGLRGWEIVTGQLWLGSLLRRRTVLEPLWRKAFSICHCCKVAAMPSKAKPLPMPPRSMATGFNRWMLESSCESLIHILNGFHEAELSQSFLNSKRRPILTSKA